MLIKRLHVLCYYCLFPCLLLAQGQQALEVLSPRVNDVRTHSSNSLGTFKLDSEKLAGIYQEGLPEKLDWQLSINGASKTFALKETKIWASQVGVLDGTNRSVELDPGRHYQYLSQDTLITLSVFKNQLNAHLTFRNESYALGASKQAPEIYTLIQSDQGAAPGACYTSDEIDASIIRKMERLTSPKVLTRTSLPPIDVYFELDHFLYEENNESIAESVAFFSSIFNGVQLLYAREGINLRIHSIKVWDRPDNFSTLNASTALRSFKDYIEDTQFSPSWDIAVLISRFSNEDSSAPHGGLANIDGLCNSAKKQAYTNINVSTDSFPQFSWSVFLISHEIGHTLGAPHSHNCRWPEGPLDNCYCPEGDCPDGPSVQTTGGTIMSYCYLRRPFQSSCPEFPSGTNPGVNFLLGFGEYPRALMQQNIMEASCLKGNKLEDLPNLQADTAAVFVQVNDSLQIKGLKVWNNGMVRVDSFDLQLNQRQLNFTDTLTEPDLLLTFAGLNTMDTLVIDTTLWWPTSNHTDTSWTWILDPQQDIQEWHEGDNWRPQQLQQNFQFPQLAVSTNFKLIDSTYFFKLDQLDIRNVGGDIAAPIRITYYLSLDQVLDEEDFLIGNNTSQWLPQQGKISWPLVFLKPDLIVPEGTYYLISHLELVGAIIPLAYPNQWTMVCQEKIEISLPRFGWFRN